MNRLRTSAAAVVLAASLAGCATPPATPSPASAGSTECPAKVTVEESSNGSSICLAVRGELTVQLAPQWANPETDNPGVLAHAPDSSATGVFIGLSTGQATVHTDRSACPSPKPGELSCHAREAFTLHVVVG